MMINTLYRIAEQIVFESCGGGSYRQAAEEPLMSKIKDKLQIAMPKGSKIKISPKRIVIEVENEKVIVI